MKLISIHTANTPSGDNDVRLPIPYPFHCVPETGEVTRQDFWRGSPTGIAGFQNEIEAQQIDLTWEEAVADPDRMIGMFPILLDSTDGIATWTTPVTRYTIHENH